MDSPLLEDAGTVRAGGFFQLQRDPLILWEGNTELGAVVARKAVLHVGAAFEVNKVLGLRAVVPGAVQWGTEVPDLSRDGPVLGDASVGMRLRFVRRDALQAAVRGDLFLPTATRLAWMGENLPRGQFGAVVLGRLGAFDLLGDYGLQFRTAIPTAESFVLGTELLASHGLRYHVWRDRVALGLSTVNRVGLEDGGGRGAESPFELLSSVQLQPTPSLTWDLGLGKGLGDGYGTTELRVFAGATWVHRRPPPEPLPRVAIREVPPEVPPPVEVPPPEPPPEEWKPQELARVTGERIVIREPIEFEFATSRILEQSLPTLRYVASLLNENPLIAHVVIEGHASEEGTFIYNYDLSILRSRAIWEELIKAGTHPDRISYRGMGEVVPRTAGSDEAALAGNRRVEFHIVRQYEPGDTPLPLRPAPRFPWSGDPAPAVFPPPPPPAPVTAPPPLPAGKVRTGTFDDDLDDAAPAPPPAAPPTEAP